MTAATAAARALAARRPRATYTCQVCDREFEAIARTGSKAPRYCGRTCRERAYQKRRNEPMQPVQIDNGQWILARQDPTDPRRYYVSLDAATRKATGCHTSYGALSYVAGDTRAYRTRAAAEKALAKLNEDE